MLRNDNDYGIRVTTSTIRRNSPSFVDSKIHHNNLINNILAKIQSNYAGTDAALMLDERGFVAELNGTNVFMVRNDKIFTPFPHACLHGITRGMVIEICEKQGLNIEERNISLTEFYTADQIFGTGTMGELTPIVEVDGRKIINKSNNTLMQQIQKHFNNLIPDHCVSI